MSDKKPNAQLHLGCMYPIKGPDPNYAHADFCPECGDELDERELLTLFSLEDENLDTIVQACIDTLMKRNGFDHFWLKIEDDLQDEILYEMKARIQTRLKEQDNNETKPLDENNSPENPGWRVD